MCVAGNWHGDVNVTDWSGRYWIDEYHLGNPRRMSMRFRYFSPAPWQATVVLWSSEGWRQFHNELVVFNMETQRFFPMVLQPPKKKSGDKHADPSKNVGGGLAEELGQLGLAGSSDDDEYDDVDG